MFGFKLSLLKGLKKTSNNVTLTPGTIYRGYAVSREPDDCTRPPVNPVNPKLKPQDVVLRKPNAMEIHVIGRTINKPTLDAAIRVGSVEARKPHQNLAVIQLVNEDNVQYHKRNFTERTTYSTGLTEYMPLEDEKGKKIPVIKIFNGSPEYGLDEQYAPEQVIRHEVYHARITQEAMEKGKIKKYIENYNKMPLVPGHSKTRFDDKEEREANEYAYMLASDIPRYNAQREIEIKDGTYDGIIDEKEREAFEERERARSPKNLALNFRSISPIGSWRNTGYKIEGASPKMQAQWRATPEEKKIQLRGVLPDLDKDGVPDKFDCEPFNPRKQDDETDLAIKRAAAEERKQAIIQTEAETDSGFKTHIYRNVPENESNVEKIARLEQHRDDLKSLDDSDFEQIRVSSIDVLKKRLAEKIEERDQIDARVNERTERLKRAKTPEEVDELIRGWG